MGYHDGRPAVSDLRGILGDRYDDVIEKAAEAMSDDWDPSGSPILAAMNRDFASSALATVLPGLLAVERERADVAEAKAARYAWIIRQYAEADRVRCGWCGARPADPVEIDGIRYCNHKDSPSPTCYELGVQRKGHLAAMSEYDEGEPINPVGIR